MALNFPISPNVDDLYDDGTTTWKWDGTSWNLLSYDVSPSPQNAITSISGDTGTLNANSSTTALTIAGGTVANWTISGTTFSGAPSGQTATVETSSSSPNKNFTDTGIVLDSGGSLHAKEFHVDSAGNAKFRGELIGNDVTVDGTLTIPSSGGSSTVSFTDNDMNNRFISAVGSGAGYYQGFIKLTGNTNHVKTIGFHFIDGAATSGASSISNIDTRTAAFDTIMPLSNTSHGSISGFAIYPSSEEVPGGNNTGTSHDSHHYGLRPVDFDPTAGRGGIDNSNRIYAGMATVNMPFSFVYNGANTVNLFMRAQGDSGTDSCTVEARFIKFGI